jgi:hypothetical protein
VITSNVQVVAMANKCAGAAYNMVLQLNDCIKQNGDAGGWSNARTATPGSQFVVGPNPASNQVTVLYTGKDNVLFRSSY